MESKMDFNGYQFEASNFRVYPDDAKIIYPALGIAGEAGEVANKVKKILRDSSGRMSEEVFLAIVDELEDVGWYIAAMCDDLGISMESVFTANLTKLYGREVAGTIQGSGDKR